VAKAKRLASGAFATQHGPRMTHQAYIPHISNVIFPELALRFLERGQ